MQPNLLTQVALTVGSRQGENVATAALVHILNSSPSARSAAVAHINGVSAIALPNELAFSTQVGATAAGIADAVATDAGNRERVIIEAKLSAGFHGMQLETYVRRLAGVVVRPCLLLIVAPAVRCESLWRHARVLLGLEQGDGNRVTATADEITVSVTSWEALLDALGPAVDSDAVARNDLEQLRGLFHYLAKAAVLPIDGDDVSQRRGQICHSTWRIAEGAIDALLKYPKPNLRLYSSRSKGGGFWGAGAYLVAGSTEVWFGVWLPSWVQHAETPYWLQFKNLDGVRGPRLAAALQEVGNVMTAFYRSGDNDVVAALTPPLARDETQAVDYLTTTLDSIAPVVVRWEDATSAVADDGAVASPSTAE